MVSSDNSGLGWSAVETVDQKEKKNYAGSKTLPALIKEKGDTLAQSAMSLPAKGKRKLVGIWMVAGSPLLLTKTLVQVRVL